MDYNTIICLLIYYIGIISCAAQGAEKGKNRKGIPVLHYIVNAFGGGFMRDIILNVHPLLFTLSALPDLALVVIIGFLYTYCFFILKANKKYYHTIIRLVTLADALGLGSFVGIGMERAFVYSNNALTIIVCGYVTAIGGGILASGKQLKNIFKNKKTINYHLVTLLGCCYYYIFRHSLCLICFIAIELFLTNINYRALYTTCFYKLITSHCKIFFLYPAIYNKNNSFQRQEIIRVTKKPWIYSQCPKIYLIQRRIRQC